MRCALLAMAISLCMIAPGLPAFAAEPHSATSDREDQLKAAYVFNFVKFVDWPLPGDGTPIAICFIGADGVRAALASGIDNKKVGKRGLAVRSLAANEMPEGCHVVYIEAGLLETYPQIVSTYGARPVLTVSDSSGFARNGGMIELFTDRNKLKFNINIDRASYAGLRISSQVLHLAANVEGVRR